MSEVCACGCGRPVRDSLYWASEVCHVRWLGRQRDRVVPMVRTYCGTTYTDRPVDLPVEVDPDSTAPPLPPADESGTRLLWIPDSDPASAVELTPTAERVRLTFVEMPDPPELSRGWLARWLDRTFRKGENP